jgi:hypothetical protein
LELELFRRTGKSFQDFFELIMQKADASFVMVKPMGNVGDWKADGYSTETGTVYQCYAPEEMTGTKAAGKVEEDFNGALNYWKDKMRGWNFVWSSESALPPQVVATLADLKIKFPHLTIDHTGRAGLWKIVQGLSLADRESLLGAVPDLRDAPITTAAEITLLMHHLGARGYLPADTANLDLTALADKIHRNHLSAAVTATVTVATPVAKLVRDYVTNMPDPDFSQRIASDLAGKYLEFATSTADADVIFGNLVQYVLGTSSLKLYWAAAGIVTHYFELCDVFER